MLGDNTNVVWGVMDVIPRTNFPDIRKKSLLRSKAGTLMIIPREGGSLVRYYIELPEGTIAKQVSLEELHATARRIFSPYSMEYVDTIWWSAYSIGQRYADRFHHSYRIFLAGDACHTHSPKAGQGMNVSLHDGYNIGWKLASVLRGRAHPKILETYVLERQQVAIDLIEFDRYFANLFRSQSVSAGKGLTDEFEQAFTKSGKFTAGLASKYQFSLLTSDSSNESLASNISTGMRVPSAQVVRYCDSKPVQLSQALLSTGQWRILVFPGDLSQPRNRAQLNEIGAYLDSAESPIRRFTKPDADFDSLIEPVVVAYGDRYQIDLEEIPECFRPVTGKYQIAGMLLHIPCLLFF
jgi:phenol 2-monooxygenase (NADPH)